MVEKVGLVEKVKELRSAGGQKNPRPIRAYKYRHLRASRHFVRLVQHIRIGILALFRLLSLRSSPLNPVPHAGNWSSGGEEEQQDRGGVACSSGNVSARHAPAATFHPAASSGPSRQGSWAAVGAASRSLMATSAWPQHPNPAGVSGPHSGGPDSHASALGRALAAPCSPPASQHREPGHAQGPSALAMAANLPASTSYANVAARPAQRPSQPRPAAKNDAFASFRSAGHQLPGPTAQSQRHSQALPQSAARPPSLATADKVYGCRSCLLHAWRQLCKQQNKRVPIEHARYPPTKPGHKGTSGPNACPHHKLIDTAAGWEKSAINAAGKNPQNTLIA